MTHIYFDDSNTAHVVFKNKDLRNMHAEYVLYEHEIERTVIQLNLLTIDNIEIVHGVHPVINRPSISVKFKNAEDEAYFKILTADGIEI
jgi:hypothetical protein